MTFKAFKILLLLIVIFIAAAASPADEDLKNSGMISDIRFKGIYPFFSTEISDLMTVQPGDSCSGAPIAEQVGLITAFYSRQGFSDCKVTAELEPGGQNNQLLKIRVDKGSYASIQKVSINGNTFFGDFRLLKESNLWRKSYIPGPEGRFTAEFLEKDLVKLAQFYREYRFFDVQVTAEVQQDSTKNTSVNFIVIEGPRYNLIVTGNKYLSNSDFNEIAAKTAGSGFSGEEILRRIKRQISTRYLVGGYNSTVISYWQLLPDSTKNVVEPIKNSSRPIDVRYQIRENRRPLVTGCSFSGNSGIETRELKRYLLSVYSDAWSLTKHFNERLAEEDVNSLLELYRQEGFLKCRISLEEHYSAQKDSVELNIKISENTRTQIRSLNIDPLPSLPDLKLEKILKLEAEQPYRALLAAAEVEGLKNLLVANGYLDAVVSLEELFLNDSSLVDLHYRVDCGSQVSAGLITVSGNLVTKPQVIINQLRLQSGKPVLADKLSDGLKALRDQPVYRSIVLHSTENTDTVNRRNIGIKVRENPPYYIESALGYESSTGPLVSVLLGNRNLGGRNLDLNGKILYSEAEKSLVFSLTEPLFLSHPLEASLQLYGREENILNSGFKTLIVGSGVGFKYRWSAAQNTVCSGNFETRQIDSSDNGYDLSKISRYLINVTAGHQIDTRNSFVRPVEGSFAQFGISGTGGLTGLKDNFIKYKLDYRKYQQFSDNIYAALRFSGNFLQEYDGGKQPLPDQLYYLGGASSVRGIAENLFVKDSLGKAVGGKTAITLSLELRPQIEDSWELPLFADLGYFIYKEGVHKRVARITAGSGIRYLTSFGAFGVLYGFPLGEGDKLRKGCFHFSAGYSF